MAEEKAAAGAPAAETKPPSSPDKGFLNGIKGWIIVIAAMLLQAAFWLVFIMARDVPAVPATEQAKTFLDDPAILQSKVEFKNFSVTVSGPGGDLRPLSFDMVLEMHYLPEERREGAVRPTLAQLEVFRTVVVQLEAKIRDHMNQFLAAQSFVSLMGDRGQELVKNELLRYVNNELEKYDFEKLKVSVKVSRRRITNVLLPQWTLM